MPNLPVVSGADVVGALQRLGFVVARQRGSHVVMRRGDRGCVIPGCGRPSSWCDAHHEVAWIHGGLTNIECMRLVCRPHHMMIHLGLLDLPKRE